MQLDHLRYFIALNDHRSITKASHTLYTTPQNVSRILKKLEDEMHARFFTRTADGILLTAEGAQFLSFARSTVYAHDELQVQFALARTTDAKALEVQLYSNDFINEVILNDALTAFVKAHPNIAVKNSVVDYAEGYRKLIDDPQAIGFLFSDSQESRTTALSLEPALEVQPIVCVNRDHPLAKKTAVSLQQLRDCRFVICCKNNPADSGIFYFINWNDHMQPKAIATSGNLTACYQMAANSDYVFFSVMEHFLQQSDDLRHKLAAIPIIEFTSSCGAMIKSRVLPSDSPQQLLFSFILHFIQKCSLSIDPSRNTNR